MLDSLAPVPSLLASCGFLRCLVWQAVRYSVLSVGGVAVLPTDVNLIGEWERIWAARLASAEYDHSRLHALAAGGTAQIWSAEASGWAETQTFPLDTPFALFDCFSDSQWRMVGRQRRHESHASALKADGTLPAGLRFGGGIDQIAFNAADRIWAGWFDAGVFGNDWRMPGEVGRRLVTV